MSEEAIALYQAAETVQPKDRFVQNLNLTLDKSCLEVPEIMSEFKKMSESVNLEVMHKRQKANEEYLTLKEQREHQRKMHELEQEFEQNRAKMAEEIHQIELQQKVTCLFD